MLRMLLSGERFISLSVFLISVSAIAREVLFSVFAAFFQNILSIQYYLSAKIPAMDTTVFLSKKIPFPLPRYIFGQGLFGVR